MLLESLKVKPGILQSLECSSFDYLMSILCCIALLGEGDSTLKVTEGTEF